MASALDQHPTFARNRSKLSLKASPQKRNQSNRVSNQTLGSPMASELSRVKSSLDRKNQDSAEVNIHQLG